MQAENPHCVGQECGLADERPDTAVQAGSARPAVCRAPSHPSPLGATLALPRDVCALYVGDSPPTSGDNTWNLPAHSEHTLPGCSGVFSRCSPLCTQAAHRAGRAAGEAPARSHLSLALDRDSRGQRHDNGRAASSLPCPHQLLVSRAVARRGVSSQSAFRGKRRRCRRLRCPGPGPATSEAASRRRLSAPARARA